VRRQVERGAVGASDGIGGEEAGDAREVVVRANGDDERDVGREAGVARGQERAPIFARSAWAASPISSADAPSIR
jgi:hypothetical protein